MTVQPNVFSHSNGSYCGLAVFSILFFVAAVINKKRNDVGISGSYLAQTICTSGSIVIETINSTALFFA